TMDSIYKYYGSADTPLLRETYPSDTTYSATCLASGDQHTGKHRYSYLWPYSGTFSAVVAMYETSGDPAILELLQIRILPGLEEYFDEARYPAAYSSYIVSQPVADRFYDDNVWIGIDFADLYTLTDDEQYLKKQLYSGSLYGVVRTSIWTEEFTGANSGKSLRTPVPTLRVQYMP
ncbi:MAG: glycoside hydrolase family 76 protein, partial [Bacteroides sp.]|nr:glycoside hydrolase family 76 protein [Bacteroides sp.]